MKISEVEQETDKKQGEGEDEDFEITKRTVSSPSHQVRSKGR